MLENKFYSLETFVTFILMPDDSSVFNGQSFSMLHMPHNGSKHTAKGETLLECLRLHNLTRFISFLEESSFLGLANRSDVTVLAPTNEAFALVEARLVSIDPDTLVGNHIINQTLKESKFIHRKRFTSLAGLTLHSTLVSFPDFRLITYQPNAYNAINPVQHREVTTLNSVH